MAHWVLQNNIYSEDGWEKLVSALDRFEFSYSVHKCVPFVGTLEPDAEPPPGPVIVMGSYSLARHAVQRGWTPGAWLDNLDFRKQHVMWGGRRMLNADAHVCRFVDVPFQREPFFIRPVHDSKAFTGYVSDWSDYTKWRDGLLRLGPETADPINDPLGVNLLTPDTLVMVCSKKPIYGEVRCWIVERKVVTASQYKIGTLKRYEEVRGSRFDNSLIAFAEDTAEEWSPNDAYVMDVADTPDGLKIVEVNNLNSAGFYKADMQKLVMALDILATKQYCSGQSGS